MKNSSTIMMNKRMRIGTAETPGVREKGVELAVGTWACSINFVGDK